MHTSKRILALLALFMIITNQSLAATWYVDTNADNDPNTCVADDAIEDANCTFRDALSKATSGDTVTLANLFTITNTGGAYNVATNNLEINGLSSLTLDGGTSGVDAFNIAGDNVQLKNLYIVGGFDEGVVVGTGADGTLISAVSVGVTSGLSLDGVNGNGFEIYGTNTSMTSVTSGGNGGSGVVFDGASDFTFSSSTVGGSFSDLGNTSHGIVIDGAISGTNTINGSNIKYNDGDGIRIGSSGSKSGTLNIYGNGIGSTSSSGNGGSGINGLASTQNSMNINLGTASWSGRNTISNSGGDGVHIEDCANLVMYNNYIGSDSSSGTSDYGNAGDGIEVDCGTIVIGSNLDSTDDNSEGNLVVANNGYGIYLNGASATSATIHGNFIGSNAQGGQNFTNFGNTLGGVEVNASALTSLTIGDPDSDAINRILENGGGVRVQGTASNSTIAIKNNSIGVENETFPFSDQVVVGNNGSSGYMKGIVIDLITGTADVTIGGANGSSDNGNEIAGHTSHGVEIGDGVKTATIAGNYIGVVEDYDQSSNKYIVDGGNDGAGVYVDSASSSLTDVTIGGSSAALMNRIAANDANAIHIVDAGATPANVTVQNNSIGVGQNDTTNMGNTGVGILIGDGNTVTVSDNAILNSSSDAIRLTGGVAATIRGNRIGNNASSATASNGGHGIHVNSSVMTALTIGGSTTGQGNVISSSFGDGVYVQQLASSSATVSVMGNVIGLCGDPSGPTMDTGDMGNCTNSGSGLDIVYGAVTIGGDNSFGTGGDGAFGAGNVISNNTEEGVKLGASVSSASILGNAIGLARGSGSFTIDAGNGRDGTSDGVEIDSAAMTTLTVGGVGLSTASSKRNVISGNAGEGVDILDMNTGATATFYNNHVGTNWAGGAAVTNGGSGLKTADGAVTIGGTAANQGNVISGNTGYGVHTTAGSLSLMANKIGVGADGTTAIANTDNSVRVISSAGSVTGLIVGSEGSKNTINNNSAVGVYIRNVTPTNNATITTDNTWTDVAATTANYWERYTASTLDAYAPGGEGAEGSGNYNEPSLSSSPVTSDTTTTTTTTTESTDVTEETTVTEEEVVEETTEEVVEEVVEEVRETAQTAEEVEGRATEEQIAEAEEAEGVVAEGESREEAERPSVFRDRAEEPTRTFTANRDEVIREFEGQILETQTVREKVESFLDEAVDGQLNEIQTEDLSNGLQEVLTEKLEEVLEVEPDKEVVVRGVNGEEKVVDADTRVIFEPNYRDAVRLQARANAARDNVIVVTSFTDLNQDKVADVLGVILEEDIGEDFASDIFSGKVDLYEDPLPGREDKPLVIGNLPGYGATVGQKSMVWVAGDDPGDNYQVVVINRDTLEETLVAEGEIDKGGKAAVEVNFPSGGDYYVVVQGAFGQRDVVRVKVDPALDEKVQEIEMLGEQPAEVVEKNDKFFASVMMAMGFEAQAAEVVGEDDRFVRGNTEPGSMVFVTWESVVLNSVVIADAGQGYFEVDVPDELEKGEHRVTVYNYNRKNQQFSGVLSQLFNR